MTKLKDVLEGKSGGEYFTPEDIEKKECIVVEDISLDKDIREHKTGKTYKDSKTGKEREQMYYCIAVNDGKETKDLHLTWVGLKNHFAPIMPKEGTWKGQKFIIEAVKTKGKLDIISKGKSDVPEQMQLPREEKPAMADYMQKIVSELQFAKRIYPDGIPADVFKATIEAGLRAGNIKGDGSYERIVEVLKSAGEICEVKPGIWKVT